MQTRGDWVVPIFRHLEDLHADVETSLNLHRLRLRWLSPVQLLQRHVVKSCPGDYETNSCGKASHKANL